MDEHIVAVGCGLRGALRRRTRHERHRRHAPICERRARVPRRISRRLRAALRVQVLVHAELVGSDGVRMAWELAQ